LNLALAQIDDMTVDEYTGWIVYLNMQAEEQESARRRGR